MATQLQIRTCPFSLPQHADVKIAVAEQLTLQE